MGKYILKRVGYMFLTLFVVVTITFFLMRAIPGDPLATMARALPEQTRQAFYARYGLDRPLFEQYLTYMKNLLRLDLGESLLYAGRSVSGTIASTSPISGLVGGIALLIGTVIGVFMGIMAALNKNKWPDYLVMFIAILGTTVPVFVLISLLQLLLSVNLGWLPSSGWGEPKHLVMPVIVLSFGTIATYARYVKASMLETMDQDYVLTARAKGLSERQVITRHVLRNSMIPVVTYLGQDLGALMGGAMISETIFNVHGIGYLTYQSILKGEGNLVVSIVTLLMLIFVVCNLLVDMLYAALDPRIRYA